jgi:hypothetical protein
MKRPTTTINRARVILRIFASKFKNLETAKKLAPIFVFSQNREDLGIPFKRLGPLASCLPIEQLPATPDNANLKGAHAIPNPGRR